MADGRAQSQCDGCGNTDDHPRHHYGPLSFHFDCLPHFVVKDLSSATDWRWQEDTKQWVNNGHADIPDDKLHPQTKVVLKLRQAAIEGIHGADLVEHIATVHSDVAPHTDEAGAADFAAYVNSVSGV